MGRSGCYGTGFEGVDEAFGGIRSGELAVFAGGPGTGKTAALARVARDLAVPTLVVTCDSESAPRFRGRPSRPDLFLDGSGLRRFGAIAKSALRARDVLGVRALLVDDFHLVEGARYDEDDTPLERGFARFVREAGLAVLVSWGVPHRTTGETRWSDLRGAIAEEPDLLMLVQGEDVVPPSTQFACFHQRVRSPFIHERLYFGA